MDAGGREMERSLQVPGNKRENSDTSGQTPREMRVLALALAQLAGAGVVPSALASGPVSEHTCVILPGGLKCWG